VTGNCTVNPGDTRSGAFKAILDALKDQDPALAGATVQFFALEPDQL
jgi:hypothetical protein